MSDSKPSIVIGADHGGIDLKTHIVEHLDRSGYEVDDLGAHAEDSADYPDVSRKVCRAYFQGCYSVGIVLCGTGSGVSIVANKIRAIRCALIHDPFTAEMAKAHNNANIIALGGRVSYQYPMEEILDAYIQAVFEGGRHSRRVDKISVLDEER